MKNLIIFICVLIVASVAVGYWYNKKHPCIQEKTYCYYETHGVATGIGPTIGGSGGMTVTVSPTTAKIYVDCGHTDNIPEEIQSENKCILRK